jgi:hypothetical protein
MAVLEALQTDWPQVKISIRNYGRKDPRSDIIQAIDQVPISVAHTVDYTVYSHYDNRSEWPSIARLIQGNPSLRKLRLTARTPYGRMEDKFVPDGDMRSVATLPIKPGTKLPPLEELSIVEPDANDPWHHKHSTRFSKCMDWTFMRKLDFGSEYPTQLFSTLAGQVPSLTSLRFGLPVGADTSVALRFGLPVGTDIPVAAISFMEATTLIELDIGNAHGQMDTLWPAICRHKDSLETLILRPCQPESGYTLVPQTFLDVKYLELIAKEFPSLTRFGWSLPFEGKNFGGSNHRVGRYAMF